MPPQKAPKRSYYVSRPLIPTITHNLRIACAVNQFRLYQCLIPDLVQYKDAITGNPSVEMRRSYDRIISTMGFPVLVRRHIYIELTLTLNVRGPSYLGLTRSISWLLMPWLLTSPGHQQPWYWLCRMGRFLSYFRKDFNYLRRINVEKWHKCKYMLPLKNLARKLLLFEIWPIAVSVKPNQNITKHEPCLYL